VKLTPLGGKGNENLYRHPTSQIIYFRLFRIGRGRIERSTHTKNLLEARLKADDYRVQFFGQKITKRPKKMCGELFPEWIKRKKISTRPATIASIQNSWRHLKPFIEGLLPDEVTAEWWEKTYIPAKRDEQKDRKSFNDRKWLSMFLIHLQRDGLLEKLPRLVDADPPRATGKVYSDDEIARLLTHAGHDLKLQILMAVTMGMRIGEIMAMTQGRIDFILRTIHLRAEDTKTKKARTFGISQPVWQIIKHIWIAVEDKAPLFPSPGDRSKPQTRQGCRTAWVNCKRKAGVSGRFHDLRHTFLTKAFKSSTNPALICHYAGLSLEEAEKTYLHFTVEDTRPVASLVGF
jgi:integrase